MDGFACALIFVPLLSEIIEAVKEKERLEEVSEDLNDLAAGFFNTSYAVGCLIAPILGGVFNDLYGFRYTCDIFAFSSLTYAFIFFFMCMLPYILQERKTKKSLLAVTDYERQKKINYSTLEGTQILSASKDDNATMKSGLET